MKILVMPKPIEGVSREELLQHAPVPGTDWGTCGEGTLIRLFCGLLT